MRVRLPPATYIKTKENTMAIELHHLHPNHDDELTRLKARIAELERMDAEHTVQIAKMPYDLEEDFKKAEFGNPIKDISFNMARKIERKMFEIMLESKSSKVFVVNFGPKYDGNIAKWDAEITCDEDKARHLSESVGINYREIDFGNLIVMNDDEFENLLMEGLSRGDRNGDVVRKWRDFMKQQTKETK